MRDAVLSDRDELAIDHGVALHALQRFGDFHIAAADDLAVAAVERHLAAPDFRDHPEAVVLVLENPAGIVERRVGECSEHRLQAKRLVLTHISGRYPDEEILAEAEKIFPNSRV